MGSLFYINVPTREKEVLLRQAERGIQVDRVAEGYIQSRRNSASTSVDGGDQGKSSEAVVTEAQAPPEPALDPRLDVDVYDAIIDGTTKVKIIVGQDSMKIVDKDEKLVTVGGRRVSIGSSQAVDKGVEKKNKVAEAINNTFLEKHLEDSLKKFEIYDATWGVSIDGHFSQISFTVNANRSERIISWLVNVGIGVKYESTLSVCSAIVYYNPHSEEMDDHKKGDDSGADDKKDSVKSRFVASIKSRLTVAQVIQTVQSNAIMTFDYIVLILVAGVIAALGLLENSSVNLVASMLISPLMGPIMAGCFGIVIQDKKLIKTGLFSELVGLSMCLCVGFMFGSFVTWAPFDGPWAGVTSWPTDEMMSRGLLRGIAVGAMVAIPSGAGVALSILAGNSGSLVGVAISASLLPPAVNCGVFWGMAFVIFIKEEAAGRKASGCWNYHKSNLHHSGPIPHQAGYKRNRPDTYYCQDVIREYTFLGLISFALTMVNIVLILLVGFGILKLKEVAPHTTRKNMTRFWKEDLKVYREYNKVHGTFDKEKLLNEIQESDDPADLKTKLAGDNVLQTVQRRTFGNSTANILESSIDSDRRKSDPEAAAGGNAEKSKGGWWSRVFGGGGGSRHPSSSEIAETQQKSNRPKLLINTANDKDKGTNKKK